MKDLHTIGRVRPLPECSEDRACCFFTQFEQLQFPNPKQSFVIASKPLFPVSAILASKPFPSPLPFPQFCCRCSSPPLQQGWPSSSPPLFPLFFLIHALGRSDIFLARLTFLKLPVDWTESLLMLHVCQVPAERAKQEEKGDTEQAGSSRCFPNPAPCSSSWLWLLCQPSQALLLHSAGKPRWSFSLLWARSICRVLGPGRDSPQSPQQTHFCFFFLPNRHLP